MINALGSGEQGLGAADFDYYFGNPGDTPFVSVDGDGVDTVGLHRESTGFVYYRLTNTQGVADSEFFYGDPGNRPVCGDRTGYGTVWGGDGVDTKAIYRPDMATFYFRHNNSQGTADHDFDLIGPGLTGTGTAIAREQLATRTLIPLAGRID